MASVIPPGGNPGNFVPPLSVQTGQQYLICFTNWSGTQNVVVPMQFGGTASVSCFPVSQSMCLGDSVSMTAFGPPGSTFNWAPGTGLSSTTDSTVMASPPVTTDYTITVTPPGGAMPFDTIITVTVYFEPTPNAGADDISCDLNYTLNATLSDTFGGLWTFQGPGSSTANFSPDDMDLVPRLLLISREASSLFTRKTMASALRAVIP